MDTTTLGGRIRKIRKDLPGNVTQKEFAESLDVSMAVITSYELNKAIPPPATKKLICTLYNVRGEWLENGKGKQYEESLIPALANALRNAPALEAALKRMVKRMTADDWQVLNDVVEKAINEEEE